MACVGLSNEDTSTLSWEQITPLLAQSENVLLTKYKVTEEGSEKLNTFYLEKIDWTFSRQGNTKNTIICTLRSVANNPDTQTLDIEKFDLSNPAIGFFFCSTSSKLYAQVTTGAAVIRYVFDFKGSQKVAYNDILKKGSCSNASVNSVISL